MQRHCLYKERREILCTAFAWLTLHLYFGLCKLGVHSLTPHIRFHIFPGPCSVEAVSASEGATPAMSIFTALVASFWGGFQRAAATIPRKKITTKLSIWMMAQRGAPKIIGSIDPTEPYHGAEIKAMPTIKAIKTNLGSREVDITLPAVEKVRVGCKVIQSMERTKTSRLFPDPKVHRISCSFCFPSACESVPFPSSYHHLSSKPWKIHLKNPSGFWDIWIHIWGKNQDLPVFPLRHGGGFVTEVRICGTSNCSSFSLDGPGAKTHIKATVRKFTKTETLTAGTYPSKGFPVMVRMIKDTRPATIPEQTGRSQIGQKRPNPKAGSSCINMPFWKMIITPIWSSLRNMPRKNARLQITTEVNSPNRTTFFLDMDGKRVPLKMSRETMLEAPISALSAVDMMAAKHEHVIKVTRKYWNGPQGKHVSRSKLYVIRVPFH